MKKPKKLFSSFLYLLPRFLLVGLLLFCVLLLVASNFDALEPHLTFLHASRANQQPLSPHITIGPYPHLDEMRQLKKEGFSGIISLLDNNLPQERALNNAEERAAKLIGLDFWEVPLSYLPLRSSANQNAVDDVARILTSHPDKKIYIHCYLGRHRVELTREILKDKGILGGQGVLPP